MAANDIPVRSKTIRAAISVLIWVEGALLTIALFFVMLFTATLFFFSDKKRKRAHAQCFWWSDALIALNPYWKLDVSGLANIDPDRTYVIVANHQSLADIIVIYQIKTQFKWVAKESLFKMPFLGWCMSLAKHIKLTRGKFSSVKQVYRDASRWLDDGISVLFFPEGTRSKTEGMNTFLNGAFKLAIKEKKPMLPIALGGTKNAIEKGSWIFNPMVHCVVKVLPPIETSALEPGDFGHLKDTVYRELEAALS